MLPELRLVLKPLPILQALLVEIGTNHNVTLMINLVALTNLLIITNENQTTRSDTGMLFLDEYVQDTPGVTYINTWGVELHRVLCYKVGMYLKLTPNMGDVVYFLAYVMTRGFVGANNTLPHKYRKN